MGQQKSNMVIEEKPYRDRERKHPVYFPKRDRANLDNPSQALYVGLLSLQQKPHHVVTHFSLQVYRRQEVTSN